MEQTAPVYIGCDVAKSKIDVFLNGSSKTIANTQEALSAFIKEVHQNIPKGFLVCESTGPYHRLLIEKAIHGGLPVAIVDPYRVKHFKQYKGMLAKTDILDAKAITPFAEECRPEPTHINKDIVSLRDLIAERATYVDAKRMFKVRLESLKDAKAVRRVSKEIATLEKAIADVEKRLVKVVESSKNERLRVIYETLLSLVSVGPVTAIVCLAFMPELGTVNRRKIAALAGVAPYNNSSGKYDGERHIRRGRSKVRQYLFLAALTRRIHDRASRDYYESQYKGKGDTKRVIIALARKLIIKMNTAVREALQAHAAA